MLQPRNTLVLVDLIAEKEKRVGQFVIPTDDDLYGEAEILAIGPGTILGEGSDSMVQDLVVGQRVLVKTHSRQGPNKTLVGIKYIDNGHICYIFEQSSIVGIIAQPTVN